MRYRILAILAAKWGKSPAHAIDVDHICFYSAKENAYENEVGEMIHVLCGDASLLQASKYDLILANINRNILLEDMKTYARSLRPGGELFISGFILKTFQCSWKRRQNIHLKWFRVGNVIDGAW